MLTREKLTEYRLTDNKWLVIGVFTILHFLASIACSLYSFGSVMSRFDTGTEETISEHSISVAADILRFPVEQIFEFFHLFRLRFGTIFFVANDLLWAVCFYGLLRFILRRRAKARALR